MQFDGAPGNFEKLSIRKGSGTNLTEITDYNLDKQNNLISGISLQPYDFLLVTLSNSNTTSLKTIKKPLSGAISYPNPCNSYNFV